MSDKPQGWYCYTREAIVPVSHTPDFQRRKAVAETIGALYDYHDKETALLLQREINAAWAVVDAVRACKDCLPTTIEEALKKYLHPDDLTEEEREAIRKVFENAPPVPDDDDSGDPDPVF